MPKKDRRIFIRNVNGLEVIQNHYHNAEAETRTLLPGTLSEPNSMKRNVSYFVDPHKNVFKYWIQMIDVHDYGALPLSTSKPCWWCRTSFSSRPLGIPLEYYPNEASLRVPVKRSRSEVLTQANLPADSTDFFVTDGLFCSFPCAKAYTRDSVKEIKYSNTLTLLPLLYEKLGNPRRSDPIPEAPHWKMLQSYGGHLSVPAFRSVFGKVEFVETPNIRRPYMYTCSGIVQECIKNRRH